ncbi:MAG TPA: NAD(P)H-dependent oxidoreductase [Brevundimonas sp.]|jgi:putative NADPH-quinone reductase|uniref:NAD(P)H-dependent oxidoreductase n=1 Tax=Brevundimonas sp. TaxID=1871086 RepID=UPI002E0F6D8A|nr:NAD(P)H-dependent oxidoreductase [Brevundimonas sp.]
MKRPDRILIIDGHPDPSADRLGHALVAAYADGARTTGAEVQVHRIADLRLPPLERRADWEAPAPKVIAGLQDDLRRAEHLVLVYPLWLGDMPAALKAYLEQTLRPGFAVPEPRTAPGGLKGKSARVIVTMGMPSAFYRLWYGAHTVKSLARNILNFCGVTPVRTTLIGLVEGASPERTARRIAMVRDLGRRRV